VIHLAEHQHGEFRAYIKHVFGARPQQPAADTQQKIDKANTRQTRGRRRTILRSQSTTRSNSRDDVNHVVRHIKCDPQVCDKTPGIPTIKKKPSPSLQTVFCHLLDPP